MESPETVACVGCDVHRTFSTWTARDGMNRVVMRGRLDHRDRASMRKVLSGFPAGTPVVLESSFGWQWMSEELGASGLRPRLAHARKVASWRSARGLAKSNRLDSDLLSELPLQTPPWWEVWRPPTGVCQQREWMRHRMNLVKKQTRLKNQIHAILHRHGVLHGFADLFGVKGRLFLKALRAGKTSPNVSASDFVVLPISARTSLGDLLQLLDQLRGQIARVTRELRSQVRRSEAGERLRTIPGIGWVLAYTILAEVGDIKRFRSAKHLSSYSLLAPMSWDSGEEDPDGEPVGRHVGFIGRRTLKWAFIEGAHSAIRKGGRFREIYDRRTSCGKRDRNRGLIAVAHEMCRMAFLTWSKGVEYSETPPPRPGSRLHNRRLVR